MISAVLVVIGGAAIAFMLVNVLFARFLRVLDGRGRCALAVERLRTAREQCVITIGPTAAFAVFFAAGAFVMTGIGIALGEALALLEEGIDRPTFRWIERVRDPGWAHLVEAVGRMGNIPQTRWTAVIAAVGLMFLMRRRPWVPPLLIGSVMIVQKYVQTGLAAMVDRGHPPTTLGTYPSGGCTRTIAFFGVILYLIMFHTGANRRWRGAGWGLIAVLGFIEGYSRTYLSKHWLTDVVGGWAIGCMLLAVAVFAGAALLAEPDRPAEPDQKIGRIQPPVSSSFSTLATASAGVSSEVSSTRSASSGSS